MKPVFVEKLHSSKKVGTPEEMFTHLGLRAKILTTHQLKLCPLCEVIAIRLVPPALAPAAWLADTSD